MPPTNTKQFTFINVSNPSQANDAATRKQVRSVSAVEGWATRPRTNLLTATSAAPGNETADPTAHRSSERSRQLGGISGDLPLHGRSMHQNNHQSQARSPQAIRPHFCTHTFQPSFSMRSPCNCLISHTAKPSLLAISPHPTDLGRGNADPFNAYPVDSRPWFGWVLDHCVLARLDFAAYMLTCFEQILQSFYHEAIQPWP